MAYMNQDKKKALEPRIKEILQKYGMKGRLGVHNHSMLILKITAGSIDFGKGVQDINHYHYDNFFASNPKALAFLSELVPAMNATNHDNSDIQSDYFDVGYYISIRIGEWNKPYILT